MKFLIVGGFLGSGKTSFIIHLAKYLVQVRGIKNVAILENEIGEVGIDDALLRSSGYEVKGLFSGCVCCTMAGELLVNVRMLQRDLDPDWIIMEATGVAMPDSIQASLKQKLDIDAQVVCLADAKRWNKLIKAMANILSMQLNGADVVLLNKSDLVDEESLEAAKASIHEINSTARIETCSALETMDEGVLARIVDWERNV